MDAQTTSLSVFCSVLFLCVVTTFCCQDEGLKLRSFYGALGVLFNLFFSLTCFYQYWVSWTCEGFGINCIIFFLSLVCSIILPPVIGFVGNKCFENLSLDLCEIMFFVIVGPGVLFAKRNSRGKKVNQIRLLTLIGSLAQVKFISCIVHV